MATETANSSFEKPNHEEVLPTTTSRDEAVHRIRTANSISISPELFEKLYLSPQNVVAGGLRKTFGNPTPLALVGFVVALTPLAIQLAGWRGTGGAGAGAATIGPYLFFGGLLLILGSVGEWILGNTFPFVVFGSYGAFFLSFGVTLQPAYNAFGSYATDTTDPASGLSNPAFYASYGFFWLALALLSLLFFVGSLRTNITFATIFFTLTIGFGTLTGTYWQVANGNTSLAGKLQKTSGAFLFVTSAAGWYLLAALVLATLDFPFGLPVGDLSHLIRGRSQRATVAESKV